MARDLHPSTNRVNGVQHDLNGGDGYLHPFHAQGQTRRLSPTWITDYISPRPSPLIDNLPDRVPGQPLQNTSPLSSRIQLAVGTDPRAPTAEAHAMESPSPPPLMDESGTLVPSNPNAPNDMRTRVLESFDPLSSAIAFPAGRNTRPPTPELDAIFDVPPIRGRDTRPSTPDVAPIWERDTRPSTPDVDVLPTVPRQPWFQQDDLVALLHLVRSGSSNEQEEMRRLPIHASNHEFASMIFNDTSAYSPISAYIRLHPALDSHTAVPFQVRIVITPTIENSPGAVPFIHLAIESTGPSEAGVGHLRRFWADVADEVAYNYAFLLSVAIRRVLQRHP
ncbi:hypothetical protein LXA43DRAFT_1102855 [Ganoderma leucocontextum]|nr:hypothetical protein LXA43DRAFT_1102855 [Ganoderma leucocontextum]